MRGLDHNDLTGRNLVFLKSGCLGEVIACGVLTLLTVKI